MKLLIVYNLAMGIDPTSPRHRIEYRQEGVVITLPVAKYPSRLVYVGLTVLAFVFATSVILWNPIPYLISFVIVIVIYGGTGIAITLVAAWLLFGVEETSVSAKGLHVSQVVSGWRRERLFPTALIRNLRAAAPEKVSLFNQIESSIPKRRMGRIAFDYGARTYRFFIDLEPAEAQTVAEILADGLTHMQDEMGRIKYTGKIEKLHPPRHRVEELDRGVRVILPGRKQLSTILLSLNMIVIVSLPAACFGFFIVTSIEVIRQAPENPLGSAIVWSGCLLPYIGLILLLSYRTIGPMFTTEIVEMDQDTVRYRTELMTLKRVNAYETSAISNLRALPDSQFIPGEMLWILGGRVSFDYEDRTFQIFKYIEEAEADMIADLLRPFLPEEKE